MTTLASVEDLAGLMKATLDETQARLTLERVSGAIRGYCQWAISRQVLTGQVFNAYGRRKLYLPTLHLVSVELVVEDGVTLTTVPAPPAVPYPTDDAYVFTSYGALIRNGFWSNYYDGVVVDYTHGYLPSDAEMDVVRGVCLSAAARLLEDPTGHHSETVGSESWVASDPDGGTLTKSDKADLEPFVLDYFG